jgi:anti-sigma regulatory factor (Ser/Thr protein kinase)
MESLTMPDRDHGRRAVATLPTTPTEQLDRPAAIRDRRQSAFAHPIDQQRRVKEDGAQDHGAQDHGVTGDEWPLRSYLQLGALPGAVPCARLHTKLVLWEWGIDHLVETAELLVSEIITNAVRVSASPANDQGGSQRPSGLPTVWFWLAADRRNVLIQVWDGSPETPTRHEVDPEAESGRGLLLVDRLSDRWGSYTPDGWSGKVVWAIISEDQERQPAS